MSGMLPGFVVSILTVGAALLVCVVGIAVILVVALYIIDVSQTKHAIRRNYPVIGRLRYSFEHMGQFFRQYFFAMDREEMPFNREQRGWAYRVLLLQAPASDRRGTWRRRTRICLACFPISLFTYSRWARRFSCAWSLSR